MKTELLFGKNAKNELATGVDHLALAVVNTLGPSGRNAVMETETEGPYSTKDGVAVAKRVKTDSHTMNMGIKMLREAAIRTADVAGDGTTTSIALAGSMIREGIKHVDNGYTPVRMKEGMDLALEKAVEHLKMQSMEVGDDMDAVQKVATLSANNNSEIGELVRQAIESVGKQGIVNLEDGGTEDEIAVTKGMHFESGYLSPAFANTGQQVYLKDPFIYMCDEKIISFGDIERAAQFAIEKNKSLVVIARDIQQEALSTLIAMKQKLPVLGVKAPGMGKMQTAYMEDIASVVGGTVITKDKGVHPHTINPDDLGKAKEILSDKSATQIKEGNSNSERKENRVKDLEDKKAYTDSEYERDRLSNRIAKLTGGIAVIYVGAHSQIELQARKDLIQDALYATRAAMEEGYLAGGGAALLNCHNELKDRPNMEDQSKIMGYKVVMESLTIITRIIAENAGHDPDRAIKDHAGNKGLDAKTRQVVHLVDQGIIDPTKVVRTALENAVSVAGTVINTETLYLEKAEDQSVGSW